MSVFAEYPATTPHLGLPMLFVGQAQKEFFVNQSLAVIDALLRPTINGSASSPPADAQDGDVYRIIAPAEGPWVERKDFLAVRIGGHWHFVPPIEGMMVYDRSAGAYACFTTAWHSHSVPGSISGGAVVDVEARNVLAQVIDALANLGLVATAPT